MIYRARGERRQQDEARRRPTQTGSGDIEFPAAGGTPGARRPVILVVDDDEHDREIYGQVLCYNGFDVIFAATGASALRAVTRVSVDLVLLDIGLPDVQGVKVLGELRRQGSDVPVIVLSGFTRDRMGWAVRLYGCVEYIEKPASPVRVLHSVERVVGRAPAPGVGRPPQAVTAS